MQPSKEIPHRPQIPGSTTRFVSGSAALITALAAFVARSGETTVAHWRFDEGAGSYAMDSGPYGSRGRLVGPTWVAHGDGYALDFRGGPATSVGDAVEVNHAVNLVLTNAFYVESWIKARGTNHYGVIVDKHEVIGSQQAAGYTLYLTGGQLRLTLYCGPNGIQDLFSSRTLLDDQWHRVVGGWDGARMWLAIDDRPEGELAWSYPPAPSKSRLGIGGRFDGWGGFMPFTGRIDDVRIVTWPPDGAQLSGRVTELDAAGRTLGPLAGAKVTVDQNRSPLTDAEGAYWLGGLSAGEHAITVSKAGYYPIERTLSIAEDESRHESFQLARETGGNIPVVFDPVAPAGRYFLTGLPGELVFSMATAWNGPPGGIQILWAGKTNSAPWTDLGNGLARVQVSLGLPASAPAASELIAEIRNAHGQTFRWKPGLVIHPVPDIVSRWYGGNIPWTVAQPKYGFSQELALVFWNAEVPGGIYSSQASLGMGRRLSLDSQAGSLEGDLSGSGSFSHAMEVPGVPVEVLGEGQLTLSGGIETTFQGTEPLVFTPSWSVAFVGKTGIGVPVVAVINVVAPGLGSSLSAVPGLGDVKLRLFLIGGLSLGGEYAGGQTGACFLGTTTLRFSGTLGLEAQLVLDMDFVEAGVYVGVTGTPEFELCPEFEFLGITFRGYVGIFASSWLHEWNKEVDAEVRFEPGRAARLLGMTERSPQAGTAGWQPVGTRLGRWGAPARLARSSAGRDRAAVRLAGPQPDQPAVLLENVPALTRPVIVIHGDKTILLFARYDAAKPWHAATDIGFAMSRPGSDWVFGQLTDDDAADFNPRITSHPIGLLAAWERVSGDVSHTTRPDEVAPFLEIVAAFSNPEADLWADPVPLTTNAVVDRAPLPIACGNTLGVAWVQNAGAVTLGQAGSPDSLQFARWRDGEWQAPQPLWTADKGIVDLAFVAGAEARGRLIWTVDEDGDPATRADRELYACELVGDTWSEPARLTRNTTEDSRPNLVAPFGRPLCLWQSGPELVYTWIDTWDPRPVDPGLTNTAPSATATVATLPEGAVLVHAESTTNAVDLLVRSYDAVLDRWSAPLPLTWDSAVESMAAVAPAGTNFVVAYLTTEILRTNREVVIGGKTYRQDNIPEPGQTDLCVLGHTPGPDPAVQPGTFAVHPPNPQPDGTATVEAIIENRGASPVQTLLVGFFDGQPGAGGKLIDLPIVLTEPLLGGRSKRLSVSWTVPPAPASHRLYVFVDPNQSSPDRDRSNNLASLATVLPDLTIETAWAEPASATGVALVARLRNLGTVAAEPFQLAWRLGGPHGDILGTNQVTGLNAGATIEVAHYWTTTDRTFTERWTRILAVADASQAVIEPDEANNDRSFAAQVVPGWVPWLSEFHPLPTGSVVLRCEVDTLPAEDLFVETTASLTSPGGWMREPALTFTEIEPGRFETVVGAPPGTRFYRVGAELR